jgi:hypothetical protein
MTARRPPRETLRRPDIVNVHLRRFTSRGKPAAIAAALVAVAACVVAGCAAGDQASTELVAKVELPSRKQVEVRVIVRPEHARQAARYLDAARATLKAYATRFGALPFTRLSVVDPGWLTSPPAAGSDPAVVFATTRWLAPGNTMEPELAVTRAIGERFWQRALSCGESSWFVDGLNRYTSTPVVASQFAFQQTPPAFAYAEGRYFGGFIPRVVRVPLRTATAGNGLDDYRRNPAVDLRAPLTEPRDRRSAVAKTALAMGTLERWVGAPTWDAVLQEFASRRWPHCPSAVDLQGVAEGVTGLDLSWFFTPVFNSAAVFDYGVDDLTITRGSGAGAPWRTAVTVRRLGNAEFTGSSLPRDGSFESGRGMQLRVVFDDGSERVDYWDGRDRSRVFVYESAVPTRSATIDPGEVLLLDTNRTNNSRMATPQASRAATKWAARWAIWLEDLLLTYASLS